MVPRFLLYGTFSHFTCFFSSGYSFSKNFHGFSRKWICLKKHPCFWVLRNIFHSFSHALFGWVVHNPCFVGVRNSTLEVQKVATRDWGRRGWNFRWCVSFFKSFFWILLAVSKSGFRLVVGWSQMNHCCNWVTDRCLNGKGTCTCTNHLFLRVSTFSFCKEPKHEFIDSCWKEKHLHKPKTHKASNLLLKFGWWRWWQASD